MRRNDASGGVDIMIAENGEFRMPSEIVVRAQKSNTPTDSPRLVVHYHAIFDER